MAVKGRCGPHCGGLGGGKWEASSWRSLWNKWLTYLFIWKSERERFHLPVDSPNICVLRGSSKLKSGARTPSRSPTWIAGTKDPSHRCCLPECTLEGSQILEQSQDWSPGTLMWDEGFTSSLNSCAKCLPRRSLSKCVTGFTQATPLSDNLNTSALRMLPEEEKWGSN